MIWGLPCEERKICGNDWKEPCSIKALQEANTRMQVSLQPQKQAMKSAPACHASEL